MTRSYLDRLEAVNPKLNAVVQVRREAALREARAADAVPQEQRGVLHGVPMTVKDSLDTSGIVTTGGTRGRTAYVPPEDATVVKRVRAAGAIVMGKTNTPDLTLAFETTNLVYGRTNNPFDLERTSGGSSGGAAAIVAAGGSPLDHRERHRGKHPPAFAFLRHRGPEADGRPRSSDRTHHRLPRRARSASPTSVPWPGGWRTSPWSSGSSPGPTESTRTSCPRPWATPGR